VVATAPIARAQQHAPAADVGKIPLPAARYQGAWPKTLPDANTPQAQAPAEWSTQEIGLARARCTAMLKGLDLIALPDPPIRESAECGTPAPMKLLSIGSNPQIALLPPPVLTCDMIAALHKWLERDVQPLARKHLGAPVVRLATMSSYSCRNAYGRAKSRLSEHGKVNALDIAAFVAAKGQIAMVTADWGPTAREIAAQAAADRAEAEKKQAEADTEVARQGKGGNTPQVPRSRPAQPLRAGIGIDIPRIGVQMPGSAQSTGLGLTQPSHLGGPKEARTAPPAPTEPLTGKAVFLRVVHEAACKIFGTVLGPEANHAHRNHFHVDMAERKHGAICE
jgi:hypothetical protein